MMDQIGYGILFALQGLAIAFIVYIGVWTPKNKMKGHAGRGKCKCCSKRISPAREGIVKHSKPLTQAQVTVLIV
jgi:hypothetical protein